MQKNKGYKMKKIRTIEFGNEEIFASYKIKDKTRMAIVVDKNGNEVNVVFPEGETEDRIFDYYDWLDLDLYDFIK